MQDYRVEADVSKDGSVTVKNLPFRAGDKVEVIYAAVLSRKKKGSVIPCAGSLFGTVTHSAALQKAIGKLSDDHNR